MQQTNYKRMNKKIINQIATCHRTICAIQQDKTILNTIEEAAKICITAYKQGHKFS